MRELRLGRKLWRNDVPSLMRRQEAHGSMAEIIWTDPALSHLDAIADYLPLDNPEATKILVRNVFYMWVSLLIILRVVPTHRNSRDAGTDRSSRHHAQNFIEKRVRAS